MCIWRGGRFKSHEGKKNKVLRENNYHYLSDSSGGNAIAILGLLELFNCNAETSVVGQFAPGKKYKAVGALPDFAYQIIMLKPCRPVAIVVVIAIVDAPA
jgi:hypothetical protein